MLAFLNCRYKYIILFVLLLNVLRRMALFLLFNQNQSETFEKTSRTPSLQQLLSNFAFGLFWGKKCSILEKDSQRENG